MSLLKKILIVEDDKPSALMLRQIVEKYNYVVIDSVSSGEEAIKKTGELSPDLILMDITLSGDIDGIDTAKEISARFGTPFVYLTVSTDDETLNRAKETMPYGYILKPYDKNMLFATIEMALYKIEIEKQLYNSEKRNKDILSRIPDIMFYLNREGVFFDEVEEEMAKHIWSSKIANLALPYIAKALDRNEIQVFDYALKKKGTIIYYESRIINFNSDKVLVIVRNVTEKKKAEIELENYKNDLENQIKERIKEISATNKDLENEVIIRRNIEQNLKVFSHAIEQSPNLFVFINKSGIVTYINSKFTQISGYNFDEIIGLNVNEHGNRVISEPEIWNNIISTEKWKGEMYNLNKSGNLYYLQTYVTSIKGDDDQISHYIIVAEDISEMKREKMALDKVKEALEKSKIDLIDKEMDWQEWKEKMLTRNISRTDKSLFRNIHNSFTQGAGFGALISLLDMLSSDARKIDSGYVVDEKLYNLIHDNVHIAQEAFKTFSSIDWIISNDFTLEKISLYDLYEFVKVIIRKAEEFAIIKKQKIIINELNYGFRNFFVNINKEYLYKALYEIIINALKFSRSNTYIIIHVYIVNREAVVSVINDPEKSDEGITGIPLEYEKVVFEPFYRLTKNVYERYKTLDFGLGLTLIEKIVNRHGGEVMLKNIVDHSDLKHEPQTKVNMTISLPVVLD